MALVFCKLKQDFFAICRKVSWIKKREEQYRMKLSAKIGIGVVVLLALAGIGNTLGSEEGQNANQKENNVSEVKSNENTSVSSATWETDIENIISENDTAMDRFYALDQSLVGYELEDGIDIAAFANDIINAYENGEYLSDLTNDDYMLTMIFKSFVVEKFTDDANIKDFAFDFYQNMKYTYRGVDAVDSDAVKANEEQMNKALEKIK